jgi:hypothetical protein
MRCRTKFASVCALGVVSLAAAASAQTYKILSEYKLPAGSAKGIAVDSDSREVFVATSDGITVLNADSGAVTGTIPGLHDAQEVLLVPEAKGEETVPATRGFASDASGHVMEFSIANKKSTSVVTLEAPGVTSLCYDRFTATVEAVSGGGSLSTISPETGKVVKAGRIATGPGQLACGVLSQVYVADTTANVVHVLNHDTLANEGDIPMKSGKGPTGIALDTKGRRLFVSCKDGTIEVIDTDAGFTFTELKGGVGTGYETFVWLPQGKGQWKAAAFVAQEDGTLSAVRMMAYINYVLGAQDKLQPGLSGIAYDAKTHNLYLTAVSSGTASVLVAGYVAGN